MSKQTDKDYCVAEQLDTICYHQNMRTCRLCERIYNEKNRFLQEIGIAIPKGTSDE